ncbi:MAG: AAA family ATPase [Candidatus Helarchaeota archaeon]|nr:AAA family ATPase [Candidatus Helarchaeota archaeon]
MIRKLLLQNFKNYGNQEIEFPTKGFILIAGPNGSGKSGIGEAIGFNLGLEGLMSFLRQSGRKIANLIKYETDESRLTLVINNDKKSGNTPFQSSSGTVEIIRKIRKDGTSTVKAIGFPTTVTTLQDLHELANFNATNPFIFIPQGKLSDLIPIDVNRKSDIKYLEEFEKITGLTDLKTKMLESNERLEESISILNSFTEEKYQPAWELLTDLEKVFELYVDFECKKLELLASQMIYYLIQKYQVEREYDQFSEELKHAKKIQKDVTVQLNQLDQRASGLKSKQEEFLQVYEEKNQRLELLAEKKNPLVLEQKNAQSTQIEEETKFNNLKLREKELMSKIEGLKEQLEVLSKDSSEDEKIKNLISQLNTLEDERTKLTEKKETQLKEGNENYLENLKKINKNLKKEQDFYERIQFLKENIKIIEKEIRDKNSRFYPVTRKILEFIRIKNLNVFGPAGKYIEVLKPKAWKAIEIALGYNLLHSFITFNEKEQKELDNYILKNRISNIHIYWFPPNTYIPDFGEFSIANDHVLGRVIDLIQVTEDPIKLILNENRGSKWIVCEDGETAHDIAKTQRMTSISIKEPKGQSKDDLLLIKTPTRYGSGVVSSLRGAHKKILSIGSRRGDLERDEKEYNELITLNKKYMSERKSLTDNFDSEIKILSNKIDDLKQSLKSKSTAFMEIQVKIDENQKELERVQREVETSKKIRNEVEDLLIEFGDEILKLESEINRITPEISNLNSEIQIINEKLVENEAQINKLNHLLENLNITELENDVTKLKGNIEELDIIIGEMLEKADELSKNVKDQFKTASSVEMKLFQPQETLLTNILNLEANEEVKGWNLLDVHDDIVKLETIIGATNISFEIVEKYTSAKNELDALEDQREHLEATIQVRKAEYRKNFEDWYNQIGELLENLKDKFKEYIESIGGKGYIKISNLENPPLARMDLFATFKENASARSVASHTHSGGEKTMIIMAFILALQSIKPQPFYILDEPDAHLDPENRDRLFKMIKEASRETQYIVISPQENREKHLVPDAIYYLFNSGGQTVIKKLN